MSKQNERRVEAAKKAINEVFGDTSVSQDDTRTNLVELKDFIDELLGALP